MSVEKAEMKRAAGRAAAHMVEDGMRVGLGSGSTARAFVEALGERVREGLSITAIASSKKTAELARGAGIRVAEHDSPLDLAVDGADAIERDTLTAIKGLGGALVRERLIAQAAVSFVLIADDSKLFDRLSDSQPAVPIPVEILPFGWKLTHQRLASFGNPVLRVDARGEPFCSDNGNLILDLYGCDYGSPDDVAARIKAISGVVDHGLFLHLATVAIIASPLGISTIKVGGAR
jgi:ribose 5-phosphate isomerase A